MVVDRGGTQALTLEVRPSPRSGRFRGSGGIETPGRFWFFCRRKRTGSYKAGVSQSTIKSILNGESKNPGIVTIKKLCDGFGITIVEFFDTEEFRTLEQELK